MIRVKDFKDQYFLNTQMYLVGTWFDVRYLLRIVFSASPSHCTHLHLFIDLEVSQRLKQLSQFNVYLFEDLYLLNA